MESVLKRALSDEEFKESMDVVVKRMTDQGLPPESLSTAADTKDTENAANDPEEPGESGAAGSAGTQETETTDQQDSLPAEELDARAEGPPKQSPAEAPRFDLNKLLARGNSYLDEGDTVSARRFFQLAARQGSDEATMLVGLTYDPLYFEQTGVVGMRPEAEKAVEWYAKAITMGSKAAATRMQKLKKWLASRPR